jgi:hypothetical protein
MSTRNGLKLVTASALAIAMVSVPAFAGAARDRSAVTTELSAQNTQVQKNKAVPKTVAPRTAPARVAPRQVQPRVIQRQTQPRVIQRQVQPRVIQKQVQPRVIQKQVQPRVIPRTGQVNTTRKVFTPRGANSRVVSAARIRNAPARGAFRTTIRGRNYSVWRSGYRARYHGGWRTFVALGALGVLAIGAYEYYPYAYIDAPADYCDGLTEDGCQMVYDEVQTVEGDVVPQCVAYCPQQ